MVLHRHAHLPLCPVSQVKKKLVHAFTLLGSAEDEVRPETLFDKCDFGKKVSQ